MMGVGVVQPALGDAPRGQASAAETGDLAEAARLWAEAGRLHEQGKYDDALPIALRALAIREKALGPEHPEVARSLNNVAELYWTKGDSARAEPLYQRALAIRTRPLVRDQLPDHPIRLVEQKNPVVRPIPEPQVRAGGR